MISNGNKAYKENKVELLVRKEWRQMEADDGRASIVKPLR